MTSDQLNARELVALRNELQTTLPAATVTTVNWRAVTDAAAAALARGWTGFELARYALANLAGTPADNPGAVIVTTLRDLGQIDPPRPETTSQPDPIDRAAIGRALAHASTSAADWADRIRGTLRGAS